MPKVRSFVEVREGKKVRVFLAPSHLQEREKEEKAKEPSSTLKNLRGVDRDSPTISWDPEKGTWEGTLGTLPSGKESLSWVEVSPGDWRAVEPSRQTVKGRLSAFAGFGASPPAETLPIPQGGVCLVSRGDRIEGVFSSTCPQEGVLEVQHLLLILQPEGLLSTIEQEAMVQTMASMLEQKGIPCSSTSRVRAPVLTLKAAPPEKVERVMTERVMTERVMAEPRGVGFSDVLSTEQRAERAREDARRAKEEKEALLRALDNRVDEQKEKIERAKEATHKVQLHFKKRRDFLLRGWEKMECRGRARRVLLARQKSRREYLLFLTGRDPGTTWRVVR